VRIGQQERQPRHCDASRKDPESGPPVLAWKSQQERHERGRPRLGVDGGGQRHPGPDRMTPAHRVCRGDRQAESQHVVEMPVVSGEFRPHREEDKPGHQ